MLQTAPGRSFRCALVVAALAGAVTPAFSQTIRPLLAEHTSRARGRVELRNDADWPLDVVMEARGFTVDGAGELIDAPLSRDIRLRLSAMSLRIPPKETRFVVYDASAEVLPAWFVLYATFRGFPAREFRGTAVQLELPHVVYILPKRALKDADVGVQLVQFSPDRHRVVLDVWNSGPEFGRVLTTEIQGAGVRKTGVSFPLLPQGRRRLEMDWDGLAPPESILLRTRSGIFRRALTAANQ